MLRARNRDAYCVTISSDSLDERDRFFVLLKALLAALIDNPMALNETPDFPNEVKVDSGETGFVRILRLHVAEGTFDRTYLFVHDQSEHFLIHRGLPLLIKSSIEKFTAHAFPKSSILRNKTENI